MSTVERLDEKVREFTDIVIQSGVQVTHSKSGSRPSTIWGIRRSAHSASVSNRILDRPVKAMEGGLFNDTAPISRSLVDLRKTVEDLDHPPERPVFPPEADGYHPLWE